MGMNIFNNKVIAHFAVRQTCQAIFKLIQAEDALIFACRRKRHDLKAQTGRSMIEMLGVLAIIGVLSVGGLVGYSKAIERYRVNETINQITHIVQNTHDVFRNQKDYGDLYAEGGSSYNMLNDDSKARPIVEKAKIFPESITKKGYKNLFGGLILYGGFIGAGLYTAGDKKAFVLGYRDIPKEACIELSLQNWQNLDGFAAFSIGAHKSWYVSKKATDVSINLFRMPDMPLTPEQAVNACALENDNSLWWRFY